MAPRKDDDDTEAETEGGLELAALVERVGEIEETQKEEATTINELEEKLAALEKQIEGHRALSNDAIETLMVCGQAIREMWPQQGRGDLSSLQLQLAALMPRIAQASGVPVPKSTADLVLGEAPPPNVDIAPGALERSKSDDVVLGDGTVILRGERKVEGTRTEAGHVIPDNPTPAMPSLAGDGIPPARPEDNEQRTLSLGGKNDGTRR